MLSHKPQPHPHRTNIWQRLDSPQGHLAGRMAELGLALAQRDQATLQALTQEVITISAIEGEALNLEAVRSSIARRLGVVDMVLDATLHYSLPLTPKRLLGWHAALFPTGYSGRVRIQVGAWRNEAAGRWLAGQIEPRPSWNMRKQLPNQ